MAAAVLSAAWAAGLAWFLERIPFAAVDAGARTDAIVVVTGGPDRLRVGLDLLGEGRARKLFVSGVYRGVDVRELLRVSQKAPEEFACCVELGYAARDTIGNAAETARWMAGQGFASLRLVTSNYHLPRSLAEFRHAMPDAEIVPHPVFARDAVDASWWRRPRSAWLVLSEYDKYLVARARHAVLDALERLP